MWVRSQDKREMIDITGKRLNVWNGQDGWCIYVDPMTSIDDISISLGHYFTGDRAIEVLNYIQNNILDYEFAKGTHDAPKYIVFEMPER